jgi:hypothetical protein
MHPDLVNARLGVVYLFGNMGVESNLFNVLLEGGLDAAGSVLKFGGAEGAATNLKTVMVPGKALLDATETGAHTARASSPEAATLLQRVKRWLADFAAKVWRALAEKFGDIGPLVSSIKNLVNVLAGVFLKKAAPFIGAGLDIAKGAVNTIDSSMVLFKSWMRGRGVEIAQGHPATIVASITRAMKLSLFEGLYQMLKGAGAAAMAGASAGATVIVDLLIALAETLVKLIWRIVEITRMDRFFKQAGEFWRNREASTAIHRHPLEFGRWYKEAALNLPAISILTLNSGICGDKMRFLQMFKDDGKQISQGEFDRGVRFVDGLKPWGAEYLGKCGYSFQASSKFVGGLLDFSAEHAKQRNKAWAITRKIANA